MNVATAIRYGATCFVTNERKLLNKCEAVKHAFDGFVIYDPAKAVETVLRFKAKWEVRSRLLIRTVMADDPPFLNEMLYEAACWRADHHGHRWPKSSPTPS